MHFVDIILLCVTMMLFLALGYYFKLKKNASAVEYFLSERELSPVIVAFSIAVSFLSAATMTISVGEVYTYGFPLHVCIICSIIVPPLVNTFVIPHFYNKDYISVYQFFEERFSGFIRPIFSLTFILSQLTFVASSVYAASICAEVLAEVPLWFSTIAVGVVSTVYSTLGGLRAVVWTDLCQALLMVLFGVIVFLKLVVSIDSWSDAWQTASRGKRLSVSFSEGPTIRYSFFSLIFSMTISWLFKMCASQVGVQRWKSVPTMEGAKRTVWMSVTFANLFYVFLYVLGVGLYVFYDGCDVITTKKVSTSDHIILYFLRTELVHIPGVIGITLAGILSGSLSTFSSFINSFAAVTLEDFIKIRFKTMSNKMEIRLCKGLTAAYGMLVTLLAFAVAKSKSVLVLQWMSGSILSGPTLGVLFLGLWCKKANTKGVSLGFICTIAFMVWLSIGSLQDGQKKHQMLPLNASQCSVHDNISLPEVFSYGNSVHNSTSPEEFSNGNSTWPEKTEILIGLKDSGNGKFLKKMYTISFAWYPVISLSSTIILGLLFSVIAGLIANHCTRKGIENHSHEDFPGRLKTLVIAQGIDLQEISPLQPFAENEGKKAKVTV